MSKNTVLPTLVFDLDGTLIDSAPDLAGALNQLLAEEKRRALSLDEVRAMIGNGARMLITRGFAATGEAPADPEAAYARFIDIYNGMLTVKTALYPGVRETLFGLQAAGHRMAICTNKPHGPTCAILEAFGMTALFDGVVGGDSYGHRKPDPRHILSLLAEMDADPRHAVMIGDSQADVDAAQSAGIPVILMDYGYCHAPHDSLGADALLGRFNEIPEALHRIANR